MKKKEPKYPENKYLSLEVFKSELTQEEIASRIRCSRRVLNETINGHYKGVNIIPRLLAELGLV
jgi:predicted DNA-binding protein (UPF0251 family)